MYFALFVFILTNKLCSQAVRLAEINDEKRIEIPPKYRKKV